MHKEKRRILITRVAHCVAVCCSVLQCAVVCDTSRYTCLLHRRHILQNSHHTCCTLRCSVLQCVAVCCSVLQCVAVCDTTRHTSEGFSSHAPVPCVRAGARRWRTGCTGHIWTALFCRRSLMRRDCVCVCVCVCVCDMPQWPKPSTLNPKH